MYPFTGTAQERACDSVLNEIVAIFIITFPCGMSHFTFVLCLPHTLVSNKPSALSVEISKHECTYLVAVHVLSYFIVQQTLTPPCAPLLWF